MMLGHEWGVDFILFLPILKSEKLFGFHQTKSDPTCIDSSDTDLFVSV